MIRSIPTAYMYNTARCSLKDLVAKPQGTGVALCPKGAPAGEQADIIHLAFVLDSKLVEGRSYTSAQGQTRVLKELEVMFVQQESERSYANISSVLANGKIVNHVVTDDGAVAFSTKHTAVDEDGNPEKKSELLFVPVV